MTDNLCPQCGAQLKGGAKFCGSCGQAIGVVSASAAQPANNKQPTPELAKTAAFGVNEWREVTDETLNEAYVHRRSYPREHEDAICTEIERRGLSLGTAAYYHPTYPNLSHTWAWVIAYTPFVYLAVGLIYYLALGPSVACSCSISILWVIIVAVFISKDVKELKRNEINIDWGSIVGGCVVLANIYLWKRKKLTNYGDPYVLSLVGGILQILIFAIPFSYWYSKLP